MEDKQCCESRLTNSLKGNLKMEIEKRLRRVEMQNKMLASKLYQVCLSHDHLSIALQRANVPMSNTDKCMMEATSRIVKAKTPEEIETIYSESTKKIFKGKIVETKPKKPVNEVFFFPFQADAGNTSDFLADLERLISDINKQINGLLPKDKELYEQGMSDDVDDKDLPEDPDDRTDTLPPF
jgi:hypothetical protein